MNLRLPVLAAVVGAAAVVAGVRVLRPATPAIVPSSGDVAQSFASALPLARRPERGPARVTVYVAGSVLRPGVYALASSARAVDALKAAGGASAGADLVAVNLAAPLADGEELVVPLVGEPTPPAGSDAATGSATTSGHGVRHGRHKKRRGKHRAHRASASEATDPAQGNDAGTNAAPTSDIDLNTADENELETLPGIGPSLAERIVAFREANGPYASPDDLLDVGGMTQNRLDAISAYVTTR